MNVLVAYASRHGSTKGIAEFIAEKLRLAGIDADVADVDSVTSLDDYDAFVIGSAVYIGHWMKEAIRFVSRHRAALSERPVWLFSSGPTGDQRTDAKGRDLLNPSVSGPVDLDRIENGLRVEDHRVFFGAMDPDDLGFFTRQFFKSSTIRNAAPMGDFRDWGDIESWVNGIGRSLKERTPVHIMR